MLYTFSYRLRTVLTDRSVFLTGFLLAFFLHASPAASWVQLWAQTKPATQPTTQPTPKSGAADDAVSPKPVSPAKPPVKTAPATKTDDAAPSPSATPVKPAPVTRTNDDAPVTPATPSAPAPVKPKAVDRIDDAGDAGQGSKPAAPQATQAVKAINGGVSINDDGAAPDNSAILDLNVAGADKKGVLVPRMTAAQRGTITAPATGLLVYQTDSPTGFYFYNGAGWTQLTTGGGSGFALPFAGSDASAAPAASFSITNTGTGRAVVGTSTSGQGVRGVSQSAAGVRGINTDSSSVGILGSAGSAGFFYFGSGVTGSAPLSGGGIGVGGYAARGGYGMLTTAAGNGVGLYAQSDSSDGIQAFSNQLSAVFAQSINGTGVYSLSFGTGGSGVYGYSQSASGSGVFGQSDSSAGVFGISNSNFTAGVYGVNSNPSTGGRGLRGFTNAGIGAEGQSNTGTGVFGISGGTSLNTPGVFAQNTSTGSGVYALSDSGFGTYSRSTFGISVSAISDSSTGVFAQTSGQFDAAVSATSSGYAATGVQSTATGTFSTGVIGTATGANGTGVNGNATGANGVGMFGQSFGGVGVLGARSSGGYSFFPNSGVSGYSASPFTIAVGGISDSGYAVFGSQGSSAPAAYAGFFSGRVAVSGLLSKGGGSFKIDHPQDPANKYLYHSFVESPDMKNIYDGIATLDSKGEATVELPVWFEALNKEFRYQLTCIGGFAQVYVSKEVSGNTFSIAGGKPNLKVSWQLTGIRKDAFAEKHRIPVEEDKPVEERGKYLHPDAFGQPASMSVQAVKVRRSDDAQEQRLTGERERHDAEERSKVQAAAKQAADAPLPASAPPVEAKPVRKVDKPTIRVGRDDGSR